MEPLCVKCVFYNEVVNQCRQEMADLSEEELLELPHKDVCDYLSNELNSIIKDPLLRDLPPNPTIDEIKSRVALEKGKAIIVYLKRNSERDDESIPLVVEETATIRQLKSTVARTLALKIKRENGPKHISWRYVWKTYWLVHNGGKLMDERKTIREYGIQDQSKLTFIKRLRRQ